MASKKKETTSGKLRFKEQCYLLWNVSAFVSKNSNARYENMAVINGEPTDVINKLVSRPKLDRFFELKPVENSALLPMIKLFKTTYGSEPNTQEIKFNTVLIKRINRVDNEHKIWSWRRNWYKKCLI